VGLTVLHASDIHFGKHFDPGAAEALSDFLDPLPVDLIVLSGDFTQRAKVTEYKAARTFLKTLEPTPVVVTPGNHDIPLYRVWERLLAPRRNYRAFISRDLDTVTRVPGATVVALDSTAPHTAIVNGRIGKSQLRFAAASFRDAEDGDLRVLVSHHNLAKAPGDEAGKILPGSRECLSAFSEMDVDLILGGHLHQTYWASSSDGVGDGEGARPIPIVHTGTTTSMRGRAAERGRNSLNLIRISKEEVRVVPHLRDEETGTFQPSGEFCFHRDRRTAR